MSGPLLDVSVIIPMTERPAPPVELYEEFAAPLRDAGRTFEFVFVTYPWFRSITDKLAPLVQRGEPIRVIEVPRGGGETTLIKVAAGSCRGRTIVTVPAYRQVEASVLPQLVARVEGGTDLVVARRWPRSDSLINRFQSTVLHFFVGGLAGGRLHDVACGVRAMRRDVPAEVTLYGDFARFLPLVALLEGFVVEEVQAPVHSQAMRGRLYRPGVYLRRFIDVMGLLFLLKFTEKPLRFFGLIGTTLAALGGFVLFVVLLQRLGGQGVSDRPVLLLGVLLITLGIQSIALGLIGEMIVHLTASQRRRYRVRTPEARAGRTEAA
ncbi:MAG TPA: hypothetical protein VFS33_06340 [Gemmatimonadales bacterium]|nr:hypothetical protein [Gemmatimonadales bacterium]